MNANFSAADAAVRRVFGYSLFPTQRRCAEALLNGRIVEMQTGEGKTLAAVPAAAALAAEGRGVHILTANDYLAQRDAEWMALVYRALGLSAAWVRQSSTPEERKRAYAADVTYVSATEAGFDHLRDCRALSDADRVQRPLHAAIVDEADCVLIDEARIPLVLAGESSGLAEAASKAKEVVQHLHEGIDFERAPEGTSFNLTVAGSEKIERLLGIENAYEEDGVPIITAVLHALHARGLLHRDVDYMVADGRIVPIDAYKGRGSRERRWPAGLHAALEAKEGLIVNEPGRVLASITLQNFVQQYSHLCGMTGTAVTQAGEFARIYGLDVEAIPTHKPMIRDDRPDRVFRSQQAKLDAIVQEIFDTHATGRPVLVGTVSVAASEALSARLGAIEHHVLNAKNEDAEAAIIARAGERGAVTISTNMAGRGVDILLGEGVAALGGLHVIGASRNDSRRIDHQLRGRAGRQGDPGSSQFFLAFDDELFRKNLDPGEQIASTADCDSLQRRAEGRHLDARLFLNKYEQIVEGQRHHILQRRSEAPETERAAIDECWARFLEELEHIKTGFPFLNLGGREPFAEYLPQVHALCQAFWAEVAQVATEAAPSRRGATWTYLSVDMPFGTGLEQIARGLARKIRARSLWG